MPDDTTPRQRDVSPPADPRLAAAAARLAALRAELDRLDAQVDELEPDDRDELLPRLLALRDGVDQFDADLERRAAGLDYAPMHRTCGQRHHPGTPCPGEGGQ